MKTKIGAAMLSTALGAALVAGGSYALFTDAAVIKNNSFATGTVDLKVNGHDQIEEGIFNISNFAPGDTTVPQRSIQIKNTGSLDLFYRVVPVNVKLKTPQTDGWVTLFDENGNFKGLPAGVHLDLSKIHLMVKDKGGTGETFDLLADPGRAMRAVRLNVKSYPPNHDADSVTVWVSLDKAAGNEFQGLEVRGDVKFQAVQAKNNDQNNDGQPDSWGN
ncbi:TasA family protein [Camelliibacillus cellulosilyticus]|uniref:TasA family protein n=1 Tax=Camelliibacillus cellulosilyticus TaxID=2174486 RepID=A0ABV9GIR5_9BACL